MKNVMWKGQLSGNINLDTIANKTGLYGLGPVEYLAGEILIINGKSYKSSVAADNSIKVEETYHIKAPFFSYANITRWKEQVLPDSIRTIKQLERYIESITRQYPYAFLFRLHGTIEKAIIHIVNLPQGSTVSSPNDAHKGQVNYEISNEQADIIGFFSTQHKAVFTHHDTFVHMHLITTDLKKMGHLDQLFLGKAIKLYLPVDIDEYPDKM